MQIEEQWKPITGFEGSYEVSNFGNVRSVKRYISSKDGRFYIQKSKILKPDYSAEYIRVILQYRNKKERYAVHRLVCLHFNENKENKPQVNHIDGNKLNNNSFNLEWCTVSENALHAFKLGLRKSHTGMKRSLETRNNISKACMGRVPWNKKQKPN